MKQETKRLTSIIIAGLVIAAAIVVYFDLIVPAYADLQTLRGEQESENALYANENQIVTQVNSLFSTYQNDASSSQGVALALPVGEDISGALAQIYGIAANAGFTIQQSGIAVQAVQASAPAAASGGNQIAGAASGGSVIMPVGTISFQISGSGSYEAFQAFLKGLETNIRIFDVTNISLQPEVVIGAKGQATNGDMFTYSITAVTYYQAS